jgi:hypothetical protein
MSLVTSLLDFIRNLLFDEDERAKYEADEAGYLRRHGLDDVSAEEVYDAFVLFYDGLPANVASQVGSFSRTASTGSGRVNTEQRAEISTPPLAERKAGETDLEATIRQISYITNNYAVTEVDDRDTVLDNSINQQIFADGDVEQTFDNDPVIASGDGAVAAGDDITGSVVTGDENLVGDDNVVADDGGVAAGHDIEDSQLITGENRGLAANQSDVDDVVLGNDNQVAQDSNAVGFGDGDVSQANLDDVTVDDGGALAVGGKAEGNNEDNDVNISGQGDVQANVNTGDHGSALAGQAIDESVEIEDSFTTDNSVNDSFDTEVEDSFNTEDNEVIDIAS